MLIARPGLGGALLLLLASIFSGGLSHAAPAKAEALPPGKAGLAIPEPLRPFVGWVLHDKEGELCPFLHGDDSDSGRRCLWPAELNLVLGDRGGRFTQRFRVYKKDWVALPGDGKVWPQSVTVDGKPAVVAAPGSEEKDGGDDSSSPEVLLLPGDHVVAGSFIWDEMPESLPVPQDSGLVSLTVRGVKLPLPSRDEDGRVWLQKEATEKEEDVLELTVHRQLTDEVPLSLTTRIELRVSGKSREVLLGKTLPPGFTPLSLEAPLPARLESDSHLRVQVRAGTWVLTLTSRFDGKHEKSIALKRPAPEGIWPDDEVWVFAARPSLRVTTVEGVSLIDPQQTTLPDDWKRLPCYPMRIGDTLTLVEQRLGDAEPAADQLILRRSMWLDFDGSGYTVSDRITGLLHRSWRLEVNPPMELGRVAVGGADQFISRIGGGTTPGSVKVGKPGVEIRQAKLDISADSRIVPSHRGELPVVGWDADFHQVQPLTLHLPPGWRLFHASGADDVSGTWIGKWTLLDLFLLLITTMAVARLYGLLWGLVTLLMLGLSLTEYDAPRWAWLALLGAEALWRLLPDSKIGGMLRLARLACLVVLSLYALEFAHSEARAGLHPTLEHADRFVGSQPEEIPDWLKNRSDENSGAAVNMPASVTTPKPAGKASEDFDADGIADESDRKEVRVRKAKKKEPKVMAEPAKADQQQVQSQTIELLGKSSGGFAEGGKMGRKGLSYNNNMQQQLDPNNVVQTGPGVPRWSWNQATLRFSGPVQREQQLRLWLVPPGINACLSLLRLILLSLLMLRLIVRKGGAFKLPELRAATPAVTTMVIIGLASLLPGVARADFPSTEMLDTLRERLLEPPACHPHCASSSRLTLEVQPRSLRARIEIGAAATTAVPLPGGAQQWLPERVLLDGKPAPALLRTEDGRLWLQVSEGSHQVILEGPLPSRETVQIALPLKPHRVEANVKGWRLDGLHEDGEADDDLQLSRVQGNKADAPSGLQPGTLPPFVRIERDISIGLKWEVQTRVVRVTPTGAAVVLEVPLLPGESVTTPDVRVQGQKALVNMAPGASELSWHSLLQEKPELVLSAPSGLPWTEVWRLDVGPIWHAEMTGIPVVQSQTGSQNERRPEWRPWPGEQVRVALRRPDGVAGSSLTIDHSLLELRPGLRATDATLTVAMRSSRGGQHSLMLPDGAVLESLTINGESQPPQREGRRVTLPLAPGAREVVLRWRQPQGLSTYYDTPRVELGAPSVNAQLIVNVLGDRWTLLTGKAAHSGPLAGPVVMFWSYIPVLLLLSLVLARLRLTPLAMHQYLLLCLGLSQVSVQAALLFLGWLLALGVRERYATVKRWWVFDLRQLLLVAWSMAALLVLVDAIREGLLGHPDMQISGNGSSRTELRFFLDHSSGTLPVAWLLTVPLFIYRLAMLLWALWLASALLRWLRWGFGSFSAGGLWQPRPPRPPQPKKDKHSKSSESEASADAADSAKTPVVTPSPSPPEPAHDDKAPTLPERDTIEGAPNSEK